MPDIRRATVTRSNETGVWCIVPSLSAEHEFGPLEVGPVVLSPGDRILVGQVGNEPESLVALTTLHSSYSEIPHAFIYYFADAAARDAILPSPPSPTFVWVDSITQLQVWTTALGAWTRLNWNETRIASIESVNTTQTASIATNTSNIATNTSNIASNTSAITALGTRATNLEALAVSDSASVDMSISAGAWPKTLSATVIPSGLVSTDANNNVATGTDSKLYARTSLVTCTSGTRPASPFTGLVINETDTGFQRIYNGTSWVFTPGQIIKYGEDNRDKTWTNTPGTAVPYFRVDGVELFANQWYELGMNYWGQVATSGDTGQVNIYLSTTGNATISDTLIAKFIQNSNGAFVPAQTGTPPRLYKPAASGTGSFLIAVAKAGGTGNFTINGTTVITQFWIKSASCTPGVTSSTTQL